MKNRKLKGFTLIELIVVVAIIGVIAAILVPSMLGYTKTGKARQFNSNAATVYKGAQLVCVDRVTAGGYIPPSTVYINSSNGDCECKNASGDILNIRDYVGADFKGYFGFITDPAGMGCDYAMWSEDPITANMLQTQMSEADVNNTFFNHANAIPRGCHPLKKTGSVQVTNAAAPANPST